MPTTLKQADICYGPMTNTVMQQTSTLSMDYALTAIDLTISCELTNHTTNKLTYISLKSAEGKPALTTSTTFSLTDATTGTYSTANATTGTVRYDAPDGGIELKQNEAVHLRALLAPNDGITTLTLTVGTNATETFQGTLRIANGLQKGKSYSANVKLHGRLVTVTDIFQYDGRQPVNVTDGNSGNFLPGYPLDGITLPGLGFYFAPGNLVATLVKNEKGETTYKYSFAEGQIPVNSSVGSSVLVWDGGKTITQSEYFNWGALTPDTKDGIYDNTPYDTANDPCRQIDIRWFTPTREMAGILLQYITDHNVPIGDCTLTGGYGEFRLPDDGSSNYLSLTCAGVRDPSSGTADTKSRTCMYLTNEKESENNVYVISFTTQVQGGEIITYHIKYGYPIRCVRY